MAARQQAARRLLQQVLPSRTDPDELDALILEFRQWFRGLADGTSIEDMANGATDIAEELFDAATLADANAFRGQWMAIMNGIQPAAKQFNWNGTVWADVRNRVRAVANARPTPTPPPPPAPTGGPGAGGKGDEYVWGKEKPSGMKEGDPVPLPLIKKAEQDGLMVKGDDKGFVHVANNTWIVEK